MTNTPNLEYANNAGFLWPPIADALDTFLRRRMRSAEPFERVWRLIHLWEAIEITLALAAMSYVREKHPDSDVLKRQREFFYGKSWDPVTETFKNIPGAADGTIDQWINILDEVAKADQVPGRFLPALQHFLKANNIDISSLIAAWAKACDVPTAYQDRGNVEVRVAMRHVNSFRNRIAHVPFPHDPLAEVCDALECATEQLFSTEPAPKSHEKDGQSSPLTGALRTAWCFLRGSQLESLSSERNSSELCFVFPCQKRSDPEWWSVGKLVHIDAMVRPHVLTRVKGLDVCEYTRFRAEANAVLVVTDSGISSYLPAPAKKDYVEQRIDQESDSVGRIQRITRTDALEAIRDGDFDTGIDFFALLVTEQPEYHVGWLRLGHARREKAVRLSETDRTQAKALFLDAIGDLGKAACHVDPAYQALAHYERSKAYNRLAKLEPVDSNYRAAAHDEADKASSLSSERKYQTWLEYLTSTQAVQPAVS
jgi:hypothetical protein